MQMFNFSRLVALLLVLVNVSLALSPKQFNKERLKYKDSIIDLNDRNWGRLLANPKESYLVTVFTATGRQYGCTMCTELAEHYETVVRSWFADHPDGISKNDGSKSLFFAKVDAVDQNVPELFQKFNVEQVPRIIIYEPGKGDPQYKFLDIQLSGENVVETLIAGIKESTDVQDFEIHEEINWSSVTITGVATFATVLLVKKQSTLALKIFTSRYVWGFGTIFFIIAMLGGHMFNRIRNTPEAGMDKLKNVIYILPGQISGQYAIETQIVGLLYAVLCALIVALVMVVPNVSKKLSGPENAKETAQVIVTILTAVFIYMFFAAFTKVFEVKYTGYTYTLLKLFNFFGK